MATAKKEKLVEHIVVSRRLELDGKAYETGDSIELSERRGALLINKVALKKNVPMVAASIASAKAETSKVNKELASLQAEFDALKASTEVKKPESKKPEVKTEAKKPETETETEK